MGLIYSAFCMITFCFERVLTWACCAFALMLMLGVIMLLMVYGISIGYGYAQKELAAFAKKTREELYTDTGAGRVAKPWMQPRHPSTPVRRRRRGNTDAPDSRAALPLAEKRSIKSESGRIESDRSKALFEPSPNRNDGDTGVPREAPAPEAEEMKLSEQTPTPFAVLQTERPPEEPEPELSPHEIELARKIIGRFRRSKQNSDTDSSAIAG